MKLNFGAGTILLSGYVNADAWVPDCVSLFWNVATREDDQGQKRYWIKPGDEQKPYEERTTFVKLREPQDLSVFHAGQFEHVYSCHVMEHFHYQTAQELLGEFQRILVPGTGTMLHITPDFDSLIKLWQDMVARSEHNELEDLLDNPTAAHYQRRLIQSDAVLDVERWATICNGVLCPFQFSSTYPQHKSLWGKTVASFLLNRWGFEDVKAEVKGTDLHFSGRSPSGEYNSIRV
jgi:hypothetical protein